MEFAVSSIAGLRDWHPLRGATRYPLTLRATLLVEDRQLEGLTEDVSASGVLFRLREPLRPGQHVEFLLEIPAGVLEFSGTAAVHCSGRIVRTCWYQGHPFAAAVIDEYRFQ